MSEVKFTPGPWVLCHHLQSEEKDKACPCGYRGGIWGSDKEHVVCEMGSTEIAGEEALCPPRYQRSTEIANAHLIAAAPDMYEALSMTLSHLPDPDCAIWRDVHDRIIAALAKARGES